MPISDSPGPAGYPQTGANRTAFDLERDVAEYVGLGNDSGGKALASRCIRAAVGAFNNRPWTFNRVTFDVPLATPVAVAGSDNEYDLPTDFRNPLAAWLADADGDVRDVVEWVDFLRWKIDVPAQKGRGGTVAYYTARNVHETGRILIYPTQDPANLAHPTLRLHYHRRIIYPTSGVLNVPTEVERAIEAEAVAIIVQKTRPRDNQASPATEQVIADRLRLAIEREYGDFRDWTFYGY